MPDAIVLLSLGLFTALLVATIDIVRRMGRVVRLTRETEAFREAANDLIARIEVSLDGVAARIDAVRRHQIRATEIEVNLAAAVEAITLYSGEVAELDAPPGHTPIREAIEQQLARVGRALELVEHACSILGEDGAGYREQEAQTAIKRGYLNILHAREAIDRTAAELARIPAPGQQSWLLRRRGADDSMATSQRRGQEG